MSFFDDRDPAAVSRRATPGLDQPLDVRTRVVNTWGIVELPDAISVGRSGIARYSLQVFPPGTTDLERSWLRFLRHWRFEGAVAAIALELVVGPLLPGWGTFAVIVGCYAAVLWVGLAQTQRMRRGIHRMRAALIYIGRSEGDTAAVGNLLATVRRLTQLDADVASGHLGLVGYEARWARIYNEVGERR